jgi:hypothetical protein
MSTAPRSLTPLFKLVFITVLALTVVAFIASVVLSFVDSEDRASEVVQAALTAWQMGFGAIVGLLGGKAL